jgi:type IV pilus assembly protein PilM
VLATEGVGKQFRGVFKAEGKGTLCLDIGSSSIKYVRAEGGRITDYGVKEIGEAAEVPMILQQIVKDARPSQVLTFVSGPAVSIRQAPFPKMTRSELRDAILLRLEKYSPFTVEESILDFKVLGPVKEAGAVKDNVMVIAARKDTVTDHISTIKKANLEPTAITVIPFALAGAVRKFARVRPEEVVCLLDVGAEFTNIVLMRGDRLDLARTITTAGNAVTEAMTVTISLETGQLSLSKEEAEELKREHGIAREDATEKTSSGIPLKTLLVLQRPALERLIAELNRSIDYYKREFGEARVDRILLCGGTAATKNIREYLATNLQIKCELFDPLKIGNLYKRGTTAPQEIGFRLVGAVGLLCDAMVIDLMPHELRARRQAATDIKIVVGLAILWLPLLLLIWGWLAVAARPTDIRAKQRELEAAKRANQEYFDLQAQYTENVNKSKGLADIVGSQPVTLNLLKAVTGPVVRDNIQLSKVALTIEKGIALAGLVSGPGNFQDMDLKQFEIGLEQHGVFRNVTEASRSRNIKLGESVLEFELTTEERK